MIGINFDKVRGAYLLDCITNGKPVQPSTLGWTVDECLSLAGACFFMAMSHGPVTHPGVDLKSLSAERREAIDEQHFSDIHAGIEFYANLHRLVCDGEYDAGYRERVRAMVTWQNDEKTVQPLEGFREFE